MSQSWTASSPGIADGSLSVDDDGCAVVPAFLSESQLSRINHELDVAFSAPSFNTPFFSTVRDRHIRTVTSPTLLQSVNVLEFAVDAAQLLERLSPTFLRRDYFVMNIDVYAEAGDAQALEWHTDNTSGMMSAQVYLRGGGPTSGALSYMRGTHRREFHVDHMLDARRVEEFSSTIVSCGGAPGTLAIFNPMGFHARAVCREERRIIRVEFLRRDVPYANLKSFFPSHLFSPRVISEIGLFTNYDPDRPYVLKHAGEPVEHWRPRPFAARLLTAAALLWVAMPRLGRLFRRRQA
jgi:hypothetical protein